MVKSAVEFKRAAVMERIEITEIGKLGRDRDRSFFPGLTVKDLHFVSMSSQ